jgi:hypothetical protein
LGREENKYLTGANVIKLFMAVSYEFLNEARLFVRVNPFQPSVMFAGKARRLF